ncbi:MAG: hypothetical protein ACD_46C00221G0007 [uncultured bacterium]|nr:MAG: hypothetical protein ACD_46C00221G0007 [uncultured bacterium]
MNKRWKLKICIFSIFIFFFLGFGTLYLYKMNREVCSKNKEVVIRLINEVWSKGNLQIVDQLIAPQYTIRHDPGDPWDGKTLDLATFKKRVMLSRYVFPDQKFYIEDLVCNSNKVAVSWRFTGTQKGKIPGLPVTNKTVNVSGMTIYYFSNGKIIGHWQVVDRLGFLQQLGKSINKSKPN